MFEQKQQSICGYCSWDIFGEAELPCGHQVHATCMESFVKEKSNQMFDPDTLETLTCPICQFPIGAEYVQLILSQEVIQDYRQKANLKAIELIKVESKKQREKQLLNKTYQCPLCEEDYKIQQIVSFPCAKQPHRFCKICAVGIIKSKIDEGKFRQNQICCPMCNSPVDQYVTKYCLDAVSFNKLMNRRHQSLNVAGLQFRKCRGYLIKDKKKPLMEAKKLMNQKQQNQFFQELQRRCNALRNGIKPKQVTSDVQQCTCMLSYDPKVDVGMSYIQCPVCMLQMCIRGCDSAHKGNSCQKYKQWMELNKKGDKVLEEAIKKAGMAKCQNPKCNIPILKQVGCNWVQCRCGWQICYICSKTWDKNDAHFQGGGHNQFNMKAFLQKNK